MVFKTLVQIATFELIPLGDIIDDMEGEIGIENKEFFLTDNFADFGFDSTDPIRNLQVMFFFILFLLIFPLLSLLLKGIFCWSERCQ